MTVSFGLIVLLIVFLAWKMKGAQLPHVLLGMILVKAATPGSIVDDIAGYGYDALNTLVEAVASGLGGGNIV